MTDSFEGYLSQTADLPQNLLLGEVTLSTITEGIYSQPGIAQRFKDLDLDKKYVPEPDSPVNAWKKATRNIHEYSYLLDTGDTVHILMRELNSNRHKLVRALVREVRDPKGTRLDYAIMGHAEFHRQGRNGRPDPSSVRQKTFAVMPLSAYETDQWNIIRNRITTDYQALIDGVDDQKVRTMVREYLLHLDAVAIRQGTYFVHATRHPELMRLRALIRGLGDCRMWTIPLLDRADEREMVILAIQQQTSDELAGIVNKINDLRTNRKTPITGAAYTRLKTEYDTIMSRAKELTGQLNVTLDRTTAASAMAGAALRKLAEEIN